MAKTDAERKRLQRERLKLNTEKYNLFKQKDKERKRASRIASKFKVRDPDEVEREKTLNRERVRKFREKKKTTENQSSMEEDIAVAYKTPQALGKAFGKISRFLPKSPRKKKAVVYKLANSTGFVLGKKRCTSKANRSIDDATVKLVKEFFNLDSISRQAPGRKDFVTVRQNNKKQRVQKRYMMWSLRETHGMFLKENPTVKIGLSKFCSLRPQHVLLSSKIPTDVCLCQYHENVKLLCDCIQKEVEHFPAYSASFVSNFVCSEKSELCMLGKCQKCPEWLHDIKERASSLDNLTTWYQWERVEKVVNEKKGKSIKKMEKVCCEGKVMDAIEALEDKMQSFLEHVFIKREQTRYFEEKKEHLLENEALVQVDFAENYTCKQQDEIQTAHWCQTQVTLFTVAVWVKSGEKTHCDCHTIVSDDLKHEKQSVAVFMYKVLTEFIKKRYPHISKAFIFSDGPSSQFKNKYIANFLHTLQSLLDVEWNYFATSHGKGVVDGIGGVVKRVVWNAVTTRKILLVNDAKLFANAATDLCKSVMISYVPSEEIEKMATALCLQKLFNNAPAMTGISRFHCLDPQSSHVIHCRHYSYQKTFVKKGKGVSDIEDASESSEDDSVDSKEEDEDEVCSESDGEDSSEDSGGVEIDSDGGGCEDDACSSSDKGECKEESSPGKDNPLYMPSIKIGLPSNLCSLFEHSISFKLPSYLKSQVNAISDGAIRFEGSTMISSGDLTALLAKGTQSVRDKWLSNFIIDEYLSLLKPSCTDVAIETLTWEKFERAVGRQPADHLLGDKDSFLQLDALLVPCNTTQSEHWFLLAVLPKEKQVIVLDSKAGNIVKPTALQALSKIKLLLEELDSSLDLDNWCFMVNKKEDIPQQKNDYDCGAYVTLYARCLLFHSPMVKQSCINEYRELMLLDLHHEMLHSLPPKGIQREQYYALDYIDSYYIGRALSNEGTLTKFKFLHRMGTEFYWPRRDDIESKIDSCVFYGPIKIMNSGPFKVPKQAEIEKVFKHLKSTQMSKS